MLPAQISAELQFWDRLRTNALTRTRWEPQLIMPGFPTWACRLIKI